jgi:hypothetical protein
MPTRQQLFGCGAYGTKSGLALDLPARQWAKCVLDGQGHGGGTIALGVIHLPAPGRYLALFRAAVDAHQGDSVVSMGIGDADGAMQVQIADFPVPTNTALRINASWVLEVPVGTPGRYTLILQSSIARTATYAGIVVEQVTPALLGQN